MSDENEIVAATSAEYAAQLLAVILNAPDQAQALETHLMKVYDRAFKAGKLAIQQRIQRLELNVLSDEPEPVLTFGEDMVQAPPFMPGKLTVPEPILSAPKTLYGLPCKNCGSYYTSKERTCARCGEPRG